jgi:5-keto-L-gluconate epimerase
MINKPDQLEWKLGWASPALDKIPINQLDVWLDVLNCCGYRGIEPMISSPYDISTALLISKLEKSGLKLIGFRTGGIVKENGWTLSDPNPEIRKKAEDSLIAVIEYAAEFGTPKILVGLVQGRLKKGVSKQEALDWIVDGLENCVSIAMRYGIQISLEPINKNEIDYNNKVFEVLELVKKLDRKNVGILLDTFHLDQEEQDYQKAILLANGYANHIHLASRLRRPPVENDIDFRSYLETIKKIGYQGFLSVECVETLNPKVEAKDSANFLLPLFSSLMGSN